MIAQDMTISTCGSGVVQHAVEAGTLLAVFGARYAGIAVDLDHLPAPAPGNLAQLPDLVLDGLMIGADPHVDGCALGHDALPAVRSDAPDLAQDGCNIKC